MKQKGLINYFFPYRKDKSNNGKFKKKLPRSLYSNGGVERESIISKNLPILNKNKV